MYRLLLTICLFLCIHSYASSQRVLSSQKIWDYAPHNAFTSLVEYNNSLYLTFREARTHVDRNGGDNGVIRVLKSTDGKKWKSVEKIKMAGFDLRDPQIQSSSDGSLFLSFVAATYKAGRPNSYHTYVSKINNGRFTRPVRIATSLPADWLWRIHWNNGVAYGFNYINTFDLLSSRDGVNYKVVRNYKLQGKPSETDFIISGDSILAVARNDELMGMIGLGTISDGNIIWRNLDKKILAPCLINVDSHTKLLLVIENNKKRELRLYRMLGTSLQLVGVLPSNGDCGYMGAAVFKKQLYISYYSTQKSGKVAIFMAKSPLGMISN